MGFFTKTRSFLSEDPNLQRGRRGATRAARALPRATGHYLVEKVPVVHWILRYNPRWLFNDVLSGITVGVMLIPQALAYAKIATIPGEFGLMSSWLPNFLYFFMGTSKGTYERCPRKSDAKVIGRYVHGPYLAPGSPDCRDRQGALGRRLLCASYRFHGSHVRRCLVPAHWSLQAGFPA